MVASKRGRRARRSGVAATELALLIPLLCMICLMTIDYSRLFQTLSQLSDRARLGALTYANHPSTPLSDIQALVLANSDHLDPNLSATSEHLDPDLSAIVTKGQDSLGNATIKVRLNYRFRTLVIYPGIPRPIDLNRQVVMMVGP